jgi:hypothetical protein
MDVPLVIFGATVIVVAVVVAIVFLRQPDRMMRARALRRLGAVVMAVFTVLAGLFIAGQTLVGPGRVPGAILILAWVVPLLALIALAWFLPRWATPVLIVLTVAVIAASVWFAVDPGAWRAFENQNGPIRALATFVLADGLAALGLRRTAVAGWMLLAVGVIPLVVSILGSRAGFASLAAVSIVPVVTGVLYLASARLMRGSGARAVPVTR